MEMSPPSARIRGFNGLRALAVLLVFIEHKTSLQTYGLTVIGVRMFFVLSGYLIIGELHRQRRKIERAGENGGVRAQMRIFFTKRALRIFPIYYLVLFALFALQRFYRHGEPDLGFAYHFTYLTNYWIGRVTGDWVGSFGVFWSLSVEQQFYVVAPFVFLLTQSRWHPLLCVAAIIAGAAAHVALYAEHASGVVVYVLSPWNFSVLALGGLGYMLSTQRLLQRALTGFLPLAICLAGVVFFAPSARFLGTLEPGRNPWLDFALTFSVAFIVLWVARNQTSRVVKLLDLPPLVYLGTISYGFYLMHPFIPNPLGAGLAAHFGVSISPAIVQTLGVLIDLALCVLAASLSWRFIEAPVMALRTRAVAAAARTTKIPV